MLRLKNKKVLVTGGAGFLGSWVVRELEKEGVIDIFVPRSQEYDLREKEVCQKVVKGQDIILHLAAYVGGIGLNKKYPGKLFYDNAVMGINLMEAARKAHVSKMIITGTACSYPSSSPVPFREKNFWDGYPEKVTDIYGMAKKILLVQANAYRQQYKFKTVYLIPVNLYGPGDNNDPETGHVIPSLIRRMSEAKKRNDPEFVVWGTGRATREFLYAEDAAKGIIAAVKRYDGIKPINLGTGKETSIRKLVQLLKKYVKYSGRIVWDTSKPDGQKRRVMDTAQAKKHFNFSAEVSLEEGLKRTVESFIEHRK